MTDLSRSPSSFLEDEIALALGLATPLSLWASVTAPTSSPSAHVVAPVPVSPPARASVALDPFTEPTMPTFAAADIAAAQERLGLALPEDGWVGAFGKARVPMTKAPVSLHLVAALGTITSVLGNRVVMCQNDSPIYPAIWVTVVARSTDLNKPSSPRKGTELIAAAALHEVAVAA